jgi:hypothetical protein
MCSAADTDSGGTGGDLGRAVVPLGELGPADAEQNGLDVAAGAEGLNRGSVVHSSMSDKEEFLTFSALEVRN